MVYIICDKINSGKSSFLFSFINELTSLNINGIITPAYISNNQKKGQNLILISESKLSEPITFTREHKLLNAFKWERFYFNKIAFDKAYKLNTKTDFFIIDEIGPLELEDKKGFFDLLIKVCKESKNVIITLRSEQKNNIKKLLDNYPKAFYSLSNTHKLKKDIF